MKVICSGMSKTGTKTLSAALRILGYNVYDFEEQFWYLGKELSKACNDGSTTEEFREMFENVDATTDIPAAALWEEIHWAFPDAKIIHMERSSSEEYAKSWEKQLAAMTQGFILNFIVIVSPTGRKLKALITDGMRTQLGVPWNPMVTKKAYRQHNARVREAAPKDKTLYFKLTEGWEPLCKFLDKPIPDTPFPHRNKGAEIVNEFLDNSYIFNQIKKEIQFIIVLTGIVIGLLCYVCW